MGIVVQEVASFGIITDHPEAIWSTLWKLAFLT